MPRDYKRRLDARPYRNYTQRYLDEAVNSVKSKQLSLREASDRYGIHRNTLWRKVNGMSTNNYGGKAVFDRAEEMSFVNHIAALSEFGFPVTINDLRYIAKQHLDRTERIVSCFKDNLPGRDWASSFMKRYKCYLSMDSVLEYSNASSNEEVVHMFFENLEKELVVIPASNIWSYDETNLSDDLSSKKLIFKRGMKYPDHKHNALRACSSVTLLGNADGFLAPLYVNYQAGKLNPSWTEGGPEGTRYNRTNSGWSDYQTFEDWFSSICLPLLKEQSGTKLLIGDIVSSPISLEVMNLCMENEIRLLALPKKSGHLLQPLNVAFFYSMKSLWQSILGDWMGNPYCNMGSTLPKDKFPMLLQKMMSEMTNIRHNIKAGFRKTGIHPLDRSQVLKRMSSSERRSGNLVEKNLKEPFHSQLAAWQRTILEDSDEEECDLEDLGKPSTSTQKNCNESKVKIVKCETVSKSSCETQSSCETSYEEENSDSDFSETDERLSSDFLLDDRKDSSMLMSLNDSQSENEPISIYQIQRSYSIENKKYFVVKLVGSCNSQG